MPRQEKVGVMGRTATVLVTGAAGFIGSHLVDLLLAEGWNVIGVDDFNRGYSPRRKRSNIASHLRHPAYRLVEADVTDAAWYSPLIREEIHIIVHLAAAPGAAESVADPATVVDSDLRGTINVLDLARARRVRQFVFGSCGEVYGAASGQPWVESVVPEPISPFGASRLAAEQFGNCYSRLFSMRFVAVRLFNVYGPRDRPTSFMHVLLSSLINGQHIAIGGDLQARRDFTHVSDAVQGLRLAISFGATSFEAFNVGSGWPISMLEVIGELESITGLKARPRSVARGEGELLDCSGDIRKARKILGYAPRVKVRDGLRSSMDWYLDDIRK